MERDRFETLALSQLDAVYRMAVHLARRGEMADELVQDVFVRAFRPGVVERFEDKSEGRDPEGAMRSWLFAICHNAFYTRLKKDKRAAAPVGEFFGEESDERLPGEPPPVYGRAELDWEHVDGRLKAAIEELKVEYREVLMMWGVDGLKYREIAEIIGVPIGTVMSRLHRARKILADQLLGDEDAVEALGLRPAASGSGDG